MGKKQQTNRKNYKRKPIQNQMIYKIQRIQQPKLFKFLLNITLGFPGSNIKQPVLNIYSANHKAQKIKALFL